MGALRQQMEVDMTLRGLSPRTQVVYLTSVREFACHFGQSPDLLGEEQIREYLFHLIQEKQLSQSKVNQVYSALKLLYETTLQRPWNLNKIPRSKQQKKLPVVLSEGEVQTLLAINTNLKHQAILATMYSAGLRLSEAAHLKVFDIDSKRMMIRVDQGKGNKDRYTLLARATLGILRDYWKAYHPKDWLFPGKSRHRPIAPRTVQRIVEQTAHKAGLHKSVSPHTLRHCFATHLLEAGTDLYFIRQLLGHASIRTTSVYLHVSGKNLSQVVSPIDRFDLASGPTS